MSREKETLYTIEEMKTGLIGNVKQPVLHLLPILSQIALSLAIIADSLKDDTAYTTPVIPDPVRRK